MNADRLICGLAAPFGEPSRNDDDLGEYTADNMRRFVELETGLPLRWSHQTVGVPSVRRFGDLVGVTTTFVNQIGSSRRFAIGHGIGWSGVVALAQLDETPWCDQLLADVERGAITGLSFGSRVLLTEGQVEEYWPTELSLCYEPAVPTARILGVGAQALARWGLVTGETLTMVDGRLRSTRVSPGG